MSRLAKRPIATPSGTEISVTEGLVRVKGPKGVLTRPTHRLVLIEVGKEGVQVSPKSGSLESRALIGTYASHIRNMFEGVTKGYSKKLLVEGVGYKWEVQDKKLVLSLGFSHKVEMPVPEGLAIAIDKGMLTVSGFDKELVGQFAANVRAQRKPEPYKGKGIRYEGEVIRRKQGKKAA